VSRNPHAPASDTENHHHLATINYGQNEQVVVAIDSDGFTYQNDMPTGERFVTVGGALALLRLAHGEDAVMDAATERDAVQINELLAQRRRPKSFCPVGQRARRFTTRRRRAARKE